MNAAASAAPSESLLPVMAPPLGLRAPRLDAAAETSEGDGSAGGPGLQPSRETEPREERSVEWRIPPIRWGGTLTSEARVHKIGDEKPRFTQLEYATLRAASYIYEPWFAQVGGSLGLLTAHERGGGSGEERRLLGNSSSTAVTATGTLSLFPVSRFPFNAYYERTDSRASGELVQNDTVNTRYGARQTYAAADGQSSYSGTFDHSTLSSRAFGRDTVNSLALDATRTLGAHAFDASAGYANNKRSNTAESTALTRLYGRHRYSPDPTLSAETLASFTASDFKLIAAGLPRENRAQFLQASTFWTWRPEEDSPLFATGSGRFFQGAVENNGTESDTRTANVNAAASYALTRNTTVGGSVLVTHAEAGDTSDLLTSQIVNMTHVADPLALAGFAYTWNASVNAANHTSTLNEGRRNVGGQLGHNAIRDFPLSPMSVLTLTLGQSVNNIFDTVTASSTTLNHNAGLTWRVLPSANTTALVSVLGSDSRTYGHNENHFQLLNLQASGQVQINRYSFAAGNLTVQAVQQTTPDSVSSGFDWLTNGRLSYQHVRAFQVPRLRYFALYDVNNSQFSTRLQGDVNAKREQVSQSLEQRLEYNIGRIEVRFSARLAVIDGKRNGLVYLRVARQFGQF